MNYIVFDLEWNQCPYGKSREVRELPFEIIEIGAVKLNEKKEILDSFHALVRPKVYKKLHFQTMKVIGLRDSDLRKGTAFEIAAEKFLKWCGSEPKFCTWGPQDLFELQRNLEFYGMEELLPGPIFYEDVQKLFAIAYENRRERRALSYAVDFLHLPAEENFHLAEADAEYTAGIFQLIPGEIIEKYYSIDCYRNPKSVREEIHVRYDYYEKYISRPFETKEMLMADREVRAIRCFECGRRLRPTVRWFSDSAAKNHYAVGNCPEHGFVKSKIRVREASDGSFYAVRTTRLITEEDLAEIRSKQTAIRLKRQSRRRAAASQPGRKS